MNLCGGHRLGFYCIAVSHGKGSVSLPLCGDSPGCSSNERADTDAQSNLSAVLSRSYECEKIARNNNLDVSYTFAAAEPCASSVSRLWAALINSRGQALFDVISPL